MHLIQVFFYIFDLIFRFETQNLNCSLSHICQTQLLTQTRHHPENQRDQDQFFFWLDTQARLSGQL